MEIHHLALRTSDLARTAAFYRDVLGLDEIRRMASRAIWLRAGRVVLMLELAAPNEPAPPAGTMELIAFGIGSDEQASVRARLAEAGIEIEAETAFTVYVRDPDGRRVGLSTYDFGADVPPAPTA